MSQSWFWPTGELGQILGWLAEGPKVPQSSCWPIGWQGQNPGYPSGCSELVGGLCPDMADWGCSGPGPAVVLGLVSAL